MAGRGVANAGLVLLLILSQRTLAGPRQRRVVLKPYTTLSVRIVPNLGTRFIFPFVLDRPGPWIPFSLDLTNPAVFSSHRDSGRNFFIITARRGAEQRRSYGTLYVTVCGYELSIALSTTTDRASDVSDVIFERDAKAQASRIQRAVARRTRALEARYRRKLAALHEEVVARTRSRIGVLALDRPRRRRIEEEQERMLNGDRVALYVPESLSFGPYTAFVFRLRNDSAVHSLKIDSALLFEISAASGRVQPLSAASRLPQRIAPGREGRGVLTVMQAGLDPRDRLRLEVLTDQGSLEAQW